MKIEPGRIINDFIEPNKCQYSIPVYQRNYAWPEEQCEKLFEDILQAYKKDKPHFCGSVVYAPLKYEHNINHFVIVDGQQRLTTIYLLLKALIDCAGTEGQKSLIEEALFNVDKYDEYDIDTASKLKLKPIKSDNQQLYLLMENKYDEIDQTSGIWINYNVFKRLIQEELERDDRLDVKCIYRGVEKLICAKIRLDEDDNAQEIFERINSFGVPLSLADLIRNYVLMDDPDQEDHYEEYWLKMENTVGKNQMSEYFMNYLNLKCDNFTKASTAYEDFKQLFVTRKYTNESMLKELYHYAKFYSVFKYGSSAYGKKINEYIAGLNQLDLTTVYLFLFRVFDDLESGIIDEQVVEEVLLLLQNYSIRRLMCEISSNSLRGMYKSLYNRVFIKPEYKTKEQYYNAIVSFMTQMTSRDVIPTTEEFRYALIHNVLYRKHALCNFLLTGVENQGKEKIVTDNLTVEHILPQNKNLSTEWQKMMGDNWEYDRDTWLHTLGNLTLTGYNSELGDKPFSEKKELIEKINTKVVNLYKDIQSTDTWNAKTIEKRGERLASEIIKLYPIKASTTNISFEDPRYKIYTCERPSEATFKHLTYYELLGERVNVDNFKELCRSVVQRLYYLDPKTIDELAATEEVFKNWMTPVFSLNPIKFKQSYRIPNTGVYMKTGFSASDSMYMIKGLLQKYNLDLAEDFIYCARPSSSATNNKEVTHNEPDSE